MVNGQYGELINSNIEIKITAMAEFIVNIAPEKEALIKELVEQLGGSVMPEEKKSKKAKKKTDKENIDHTFLFGKWKEFDIDAKKIREDLWRKG